MNRAQATAELVLPAHCEAARILLAEPTEILQAHRRYQMNDREKYRMSREDPRAQAKPGGRKRTEKVLERERQVREKVLKFLRHNAGKRFTFTELCSHTGVQNTKPYRRTVFEMGEQGLVSTDLVGWGRRFWMEKGK